MKTVTNLRNLTQNRTHFVNFTVYCCDALIVMDYLTGDLPVYCHCFCPVKRTPWQGFEPGSNFNLARLRLIPHLATSHFFIRRAGTENKRSSKLRHLEVETTWERERWRKRENTVYQARYRRSTVPNHSIYQSGFPTNYFGLGAMNNPRKSISGETLTPLAMEHKYT